MTKQLQCQDQLAPYHLAALTRTTILSVKDWSIQLGLLQSSHHSLHAIHVLLTGGQRWGQERPDQVTSLGEVLHDLKGLGGVALPGIGCGLLGRPSFAVLITCQRFH